MTATIIDGKAMSTQLLVELREQVERYVQVYNSAPGLVIVRVEGDAASGIYSQAIMRVAKKLGVQAALEQLPGQTTEDELRSILLRLNSDASVHGIIVQMPLPAYLPQQIVIETLAGEKDIDGITTQNAGNLFLGLPGFVPSTPAAVMEILERTGTELAGKRVVVLGRSNVVGKPLALLLLQKHATVTICHSRTERLTEVTRQADVLIAAVGRANMVTADMIRPGATVIDVGINARPEGGIVGDVDFASVYEVAGAITPTPGGVGPLTNVVLLRQCIQAAWAQAGAQLPGVQSISRR
jgi:methylenetetrahydrofolate dehydrogenase (NADP+)/methenyltetrahydrofolate cyclohydrolase